MKKILSSRIACLIIPYIFFLLTTIISNIIMFNIPFNRYFYINLFFIFIIISPSFFMRKKRSMYIYFLITYFLYTSFICANMNYYLLFNDIFSLQYFSIAKEGANVVELKDFKIPQIIIVSLCYIIFVVSFPILIKTKKFDKNRIYYKLNYITIQLFVLILCICSINLSTSSDITINKSYNYKELGMLGYYSKEVQQLYKFNTFKLNNTYFNNGEKTQLHGEFKNYNVMEICIETGASMMANPTLTPNLYDMINNGLLTNNICKNKTIESEIIGITGSFPSYSISKTDYYTPFSLPSILNQYYNTYYFEETGGSKDIYNVKESMPNIGFKNVVCHNELYGSDRKMWDWSGNYILDSETSNKVMDHLLSDLSKPFYAFYMTLSMHGPYYNTPNDPLLTEKYGLELNQAKNNKLWVNPLEGTINESLIDHYMMACMDFDEALGNIVKRLKEVNQFDNTLFVLYGDHNIYYNGKGDTRLDYCLTGYDTLTNYDMYKTIMLFYNSKFNFNEYKIEEYTSPYMIVPTVLDLLGFNYYKNFYLSKPLFLESYKEEVFYSVELSSFFNNHYYSSNGKTIEKEYSKGDKKLFLMNLTNVNNKQNFLNKIYSQNVFKDYKYPMNYYTN